MHISRNYYGLVDQSPTRYETIHILCQQKTGWVGLEKGQFCCRSVLTIYIVGGSKKVQNYDVVIYGWSQRINAFGWVLPGFILLDGY